MLLVVGLTMLVVIGALPTTSFTSATVTRDASISTATDETAVVQLDMYDTEPQGFLCFFGNICLAPPRARLVTITNWFDTPLDVEVTVTSGNALVSTSQFGGYGTSVELTGLGQSETVWFRVDDVSDKPVTFSIDGNGSGITVRLPSRERTW
jgi:hypothetical protein